MALIKSLYVFGALIGLFIWQRCEPFRQNQTRSKIETGKNFSFFALNALISLLIVMPVSLWAASWNIWARETSGLFMVLLHILLLDFWVYWWHRANHAFNFLWRFHRVHHLDEQMDISSAVRFHAGEVVLSALLRAGVIIAFSLPFRDVIIFETVLLIAAFFQHANIRLPQKIDVVCRKIIVTPSIHWVHHHADQTDMNTNFCLLLSLWDRLFKTSSENYAQEDMPIGIPEEKDRNLLQLLCLPFRR